MRFRSDINGLRAYAVAMVVLYHYGVVGFSGGFIGVDVFFVISGYLMTGIITTRIFNNGFSLLDFYWERFRRIVPALSFLVLVLILLGWLGLPPAEYQMLGKHSLSALSFVSNIVFGFEAGDYFATNSREKWLLHTWSLSVEWQFYLMYPLFLMGIWKASPSKRGIVVGVVLLFLLSLGLSAFFSPYPIKPKAAFYFLPTRAWEMVAGGLVFLFPARFFERYSKTVEAIGFLLIAFALARFDHAVLWPGYLAIFPVLGAMLILFAKNTNSIFTKNKHCQWLGSASYSIYLWHWPIFVFLFFSGLVDSKCYLAGGVILSVLLGYLSFRFVETPFKHIDFKVSESLLLKLSPLLFALSISVFVLFSHGAIFRLGSDAVSYRNMELAQSDWKHPDGNCSKLDNGVCSVSGDLPKIFFIGDSHMEQLYPRYVNNANVRNAIEFRTQRGCIPIPGVRVLDNQNNCALIMEKRWGDAIREKPKTLILGAAWLIYLYDNNGAVKNRLCIEEGSVCKPVSSEGDITLLMNILIKRIREIQSLGTRVVILGPWPHGNVNYASEQARFIASPHLLASVVSTADQPKYFNLQQEHGLNFDKSMNFLERLSASTGARLYKPTEFLCEKSVCPNVINGIPTHMDAGHITATYAKSSSLNWLDNVIKN